MDRTKLHDWIDAAPEHCAAALGDVAEQQIAALRETLAAFTPEPAQVTKPKRKRKHRESLPTATKTIYTDSVIPRSAMREQLDAVNAAPPVRSDVGTALANVLSVLPRRTYTMTALAAAIGADRTAVAIELRAMQRAGTAVCVGRGKGAAWCGATPGPASEPHAVDVPPVEVAGSDDEVSP